MTTQPKLESYLSDLDKALTQLPLSDRADIIIEIKSHVIQAQEKNPDDTLETILASLGDPKTVANRYLQERGITPITQAAPVKAPPTMMWLAYSIKWLVIGFISFVALIILVVALVIWRFTPLVSVDDTHNKVSLGGGIINVTGEKPATPLKAPSLPKLPQQQ